MPRSADRNLLFGLLALQNNFIDRDTLLDGFQRWVHDPLEELDRVLLDRGALSPSQHMLLAGLVNEHIKRHGDDPQKSLAALSSFGEVRESLARIADPDLQASLARVSAAHHRPEDDPYGTVNHASLGQASSAGSRFRILRPHARGGLGQVSVALDQELDRPVALKEIQDRHADEPESRARFMQEAEITGKLEHPGIIPVYGLGHDASGRPFYAMRFIQGDSLKEAIGAFHGDETLKRNTIKRLARLRELLRRFTDVCNAIAYAHSRGVLHRDLKPGNIMLGPYGETLVVDWGLAKPLDQATTATTRATDSSVLEGPIRLSTLSGSREETAAGRTIGTPAYASPEQLTGRLDLLGPASDVYGLGATLYALLTGRAPVERGDLEEVMRRTHRGEIAPPRTIDATIPRPLEAICRKAMATGPEDRYASARALAADVTRWLDDQPVTAYPEPLAARASRWMRRHRTAVACLLAAMFVGLVGVGLAFLRETVVNIRLAEIIRQRDEANQGLVKINSELLKAKNAVSNAKADSDRRLDESFQAIADYYTGVSAELLLTQAEFKSLRQRLLEKPRQFYTRLTSELSQINAPDEQESYHLAEGWGTLGLISLNLGRNDEARSQLEEARRLYRRLDQTHPNISRYRHGLLRSAISLGNVRWSTGDVSGAAAEYNDVIQTASRSGPAGPDFQEELAIGHVHLGNIKLVSKDPVGAAESYRRAVEIGTELVKSRPDVPGYLSSLALAHGNLAMAQREIPDWPGARNSNLEAIKIRTGLSKLSPDDPQNESILASNRAYLGESLVMTGDPKGGIDSLLAAVPVLIKLKSRYPNVPKYSQELVIAYKQLAGVRSRSGDSKSAGEYVREAIAIGTKLTADQPDIPEYRRTLGLCFELLGGLQESAGKLEEATASFRRAVENHTIAFEHSVQPVRYRAELCGSLSSLAEILRDRRMPEESAVAARAWRRLVSGSPADLYAVASAISLCIPITHDPVAKQALAAEAVDTLREAVKAGWREVNDTLIDYTLAPLRGRDDFRRVLAEMFDQVFPPDPFAP